MLISATNNCPAPSKSGNFAKGRNHGGLIFLIPLFLILIALNSVTQLQGQAVDELKINILSMLPIQKGDFFLVEK